MKRIDVLTPFKDIEVYSSTTMSDWTSLGAIMRDLSVAQGHGVPGSLETFGNKEPPPLNIEEETEEEFYKTCGDVDFTKPADYNLIQEMLSMVSHKRETTDDISIINSNLNPLSPEFVPQCESKKNIPKKNRSDKNVAMTSILEAQAKELSAKQPELTKLTPSLGMFRRKSTTPIKESKHKNKAVSEMPASNKNGCQYTPSMLATQYYNKYLANAQLREQIQGDIWSRAEQQMRLIDERKRRERDSSCSSSQDLGDNVSVYSSTTSSCGLDYVVIPYHRHLSLENFEDCVVCIVAAKHGYSFEEKVV